MTAAAGDQNFYKSNNSKNEKQFPQITCLRFKLNGRQHSEQIVERKIR